MAIIGTDQDDDQQQGQPQTGAAPGNVLGGGSGFVGGGSGQGATTSKAATPAATNSGNFTNLTSYLNANQGAGANMAKGVENVVDQAGQKSDQGIKDYGTAGLADAAAGTASANATGNYTGKTDATNFQQYNDLNAAKSPYDTLGSYLQNANGTQAGTGTLLRSTYDQPSYTAGENNLDAFLVNQGGGQSAMNQMKSDWGGEGGKLNDTMNQVSAAEAAGQKAAGAWKPPTPTASAGETAPAGNTAPIGLTLESPAYQQQSQTGAKPQGAFMAVQSGTTKGRDGLGGNAVNYQAPKPAVATPAAPPAPEKNPMPQGLDPSTGLTPGNLEKDAQHGIDVGVGGYHSLAKAVSHPKW